MSRDYHKDNKSFMLYKDWEELILSLDTDEQCGKLFKSLFAFAKRGEEAEFTGALKMLFLIMKTSIDRDGKKWESTCGIRAENGRKGGLAKKANGSKCKQKVANLADIDTDTDIDIEKDTVKDISPLKSPQGDTECCSQKFNEFWNSYPKKVSKANAIKAWNKLKPNDNTVRLILSALEKQKMSSQWQKDDGQFIPYPSTWLNGKRWEDDISLPETKNDYPDYDYGTEGVDYL